ncbi:NAD(P)-dependent dehydrogenase, short-chain alcohol dehydrogenase family [Sphingomonas gellani]|uniref:NAD(P)-dependent dehydrogenase, short-chain alcohol dehydrogenase family n=1 Tax=Sphingomonas gellani TaxID=1166340 RepID=A0A1H7Z1V1_9SPHN|nr:SDR family NAD(P)-dependent oxidoreductase [Sphingomonas gellani]SEM52151.1 NAD(P)-dependent dehydrogenase, short-chain alcohol dehydrogenase family [Sphingomonas gellani]
MNAVVIGSGGGIGGALVRALEEEGTAVRGFSRADLDITDEGSIAAAAAGLRATPDLVVVATGLLHDGDRGPEKAMRELDADWLARVYAVNAIGPALVAKHFLPLMPRSGRCVFAVLSARIGSIGDNRLGGWYGYRAAKAALNQFVRTLAVEEKRRNDRSIVVGLHPGTVDTRLSRPFQSNVHGDQLFDADRAAVQLLDVIDGLKAPDSGRLFAWDGSEITP